MNHISPDDVEHLTTIDAYMEQICRILDRIADEIVGYNIAFDIGFLKAAGATINPDAAIIDTMQEFMDAFGNSNTGSIWPKRLFRCIDERACSRGV